MTTKIVSLAVILSSLIFSQQLRAEQQTKNVPSSSSSNAIAFQEPDFDGEAPSGRERGTGSRSVCKNIIPGTQTNISLNSLVPEKSRGLTLKKTPNLWFNISYKNADAQKLASNITAQFSLAQIENGIDKKVVKDLPVVFPTNSSSIKVAIPYNLEQNKWYRWYLVLSCDNDNQNTGNNISLEGYIQRVANPELESLIITQKPEELVATYAQKGIWYDALDQAASLKCNKPNLANQSWQDLLAQAQFKAEDLERISQTPLLCNK